jgi:hypothetical protein
MTYYKNVNWFTEGLEEFYGDTNNGLVHGLYLCDDSEDFPIDVQWFNTEEERDMFLNSLEAV